MISGEGMIYIVLLVITCIFFYFTSMKYSNKGMLYFALLLFGGTAAFRSFSVGTDTGTYVQLYRALANPDATVSDLLKVPAFRKNIGWTIFFKGISRIFGSYPAVYIVTSSILISVLIFVTLYYWSDDIRLSILICVLFFFLPSLNATRTFIAIGLTLLSSHLISKRKTAFGIIALIIGISFHSIAVIGIFIDLVFLIKWNKNRAIAAVIAEISAVLFFSRFINIFTSVFSSYRSYLETVNDTVAGKNIVLQIVFLITVIYSIFVLRQEEAYGTDQNLTYQYLIISVLEIVIGTIGARVWYMQRINFFLQIYLSLQIPHLYKYKWRYMKLYMFTCMVILLTWYLYCIFFNKGNILPYSCWFM